MCAGVRVSSTLLGLLPIFVGRPLIGNNRSNGFAAVSTIRHARTSENFLPFGRKERRKRGEVAFNQSRMILIADRSADVFIALAEGLEYKLDFYVTFNLFIQTIFL